MRRPQTIRRSLSYKPLSRGVSDSLTQKAASFGGRHLPPFLNWGPAWALPNPYPFMLGGKFGDGRMVIVGLSQKVADIDIDAADSFVVSADGLTPTPIVSVFPNAGVGLTSGRSALLGDGRLLFIGGGSGNKAQTIEPSGLTWASQPDLPANLDQGWELVPLQNGNALRIAGLANSTDNTSQEFDRFSNTWISRGNLNFARFAFASTVLANGQILVCGPSGIGPEIYDPTTHLWSIPAGSLTAGNPGLVAFTTAGGRTFVGGVDFSATIHLDEFLPTSGTFVPKASLFGSFHTLNNFAGGYQMFEVGENYIAMVDLGSWPSRTSFYDVKHDSWYMIQENYPEAIAKGLGALLQISKNSFLIVGGGENESFYQYTIPHDPSRYALISTVRPQTNVRPTFAGLVSVEQGISPSTVVLHWAPATHPITYAGDMAYFVAVGFSPGDALANANAFNWYGYGQTWAGLTSIELFNLPSDTDCYFVVRARKMTFSETRVTENDGLSSGIASDFDTNTVEILFHTAASLSPPTFSWSAAPSMNQPRTSLYGLKLGTSQSFLQADVRRLMAIFGLTTGGNPSDSKGDIYDPTGTSLLEKVQDPPGTLIEAAVIDADMTLSDGTDSRRATVIGGNTDGQNSATCFRYYQYIRGWTPTDFHPQFPDMNEAVSRHAAVGLPAPSVHDVIRIGGVLTAGVDSTATNSVERLQHRLLLRVFYSSGTGDFTVGQVLTGQSSGTHGNIIAVDGNTSSGIVWVDTTPFGGGFYSFGESLTDPLGGAAVSASFSSPALFENWEFQTSMFHKRQNHQAVVLDDGRVLVAGGHDEHSRKVRTIELFTPLTNSWSSVYGLSLNYNTETHAFTEGNWVAGVTSGAAAIIGQDVNAGATGTLFFTSWNEIPFTNGENLFDTNLVFDIGGGGFTRGDTVTGQFSGAHGIVVAEIDNIGGGGVLVLRNSVGLFSAGEPVTGAISGTCTATDFQTGTGAAKANGVIQELVRAHDHFCMVKLLDSRVLLIAGGPGGATGPLDIFDPSGPDTVSHGADLPKDRTFFTAHVFGDGSVGVFGGVDLSGSGNSFKDVRLYDPIGDAWSHPAGADMGTNRSKHASFLLPNNKVLVVGGTDASGTILASAEKSG